VPGLIATRAGVGEVEVVNPQGVEYWGQPIEAMKEWHTNGTVHSDDLPRMVPIFTQAIASGEPFDFEARVRRFDGVYRWFQVRGGGCSPADWYECARSAYATSLRTW